MSASDMENLGRFAAITWPEQWSANLKTTKTVLTFSIGCLLALMIVLVTAIDTTISLGYATFLLAFFGATSVQSGMMARWPGRRAVHQHIPVTNETITTLVQRPLIVIIFASSYFLMFAGLLALSATLTFVPDNELQGRFYAMSKLIPIIGPIVGAIALGRFLLFLVAKRKINGIGLSPEGLYHWSWGICSFYTWDSIRNFVLRRGGSLRYRIEHADPRERRGNPEETRFGRLPYLRRRRQAEVQLGLLPVPPALTYQALFFYLQNPEFRPELGTEAAAERLRTGDFPDIVEQIREHGRALSKHEADRRR